MTTFAGLTPLLLEKSLQAQFLIPMAVSLAFGVLFATFITLILVPSLYSILEDFRGWSKRLLRRGPEPNPRPEASNL
jgi:Cu/Ag efflux pump CusA